MISNAFGIFIQSPSTFCLLPCALLPSSRIHTACDRRKSSLIRSCSLCFPCPMPDLTDDVICILILLLLLPSHILRFKQFSVVFADRIKQMHFLDMFDILDAKLDISLLVEVLFQNTTISRCVFCRLLSVKINDGIGKSQSLLAVFTTSDSPDKAHTICLRFSWTRCHIPSLPELHR